jgi:hypothetical protein
MNMKKIILIIGVVMLSLTSCDKLLDVMPDNRVELDTDEKITKLLVNGYASNCFWVYAEISSDNTDKRPDIINSRNRLTEYMFDWKQCIDGDIDSPLNVWNSAYHSIAVANQVLEAIEKQGNPKRLNPQRGEALMIRAYYHFILVNVFAQHYSTAHGETDLGVVYIEKPETTVTPTYERHSVAEVYRRIERDIEEGLPLVDDNIYEVPKYHFNKKAAYAFAARFNLFYRKYDKVIQYANLVLGDNPNRVLRDMEAITLLQQTVSMIANDYVKPDKNANLMLVPVYTYMAATIGTSSSAKRYMHSNVLSDSETVTSPGPWGGVNVGLLFHLRPISTSVSGMSYVTVPRFPYMFQVTNPIMNTGYWKSIYLAFTTDETLLCRAEAYILQEKYDEATADLALWMKRHTKPTVAPLTRALINSYYSGLAYYTPMLPTPKKELHPEVPVASAEQENFLHCLLHIRRIETIHEGLRWFDIKRYGIVIYRRYIDENNEIREVLDELKVNDKRRALQLPPDVVNAGLAPNPR